MKQQTKLISSIFILFTFFNSFGNENEILWNQVAELIASDGGAGDSFGSNVKIKGNICVIGAPQTDVGNSFYQGKAYIFENNGTYWNQKQILISSDGKESDNFGSSSAISNDGKFILIGAQNARVEHNFSQGKAYVFENNGTNWNQKQILIANDGNENDNFGSSISISGNISIIGAFYSIVNYHNQQGKAYVFENNGTFWNEKQTLIANDGESFDDFGYSVSISNDFSVISAFEANIEKNQNQGKAYIFQNNGTNWNETQILIASDGQRNDQFGNSVSIFENFCLIGAYQASIGENIYQGKAYIFESNGSYWNQKQILVASDGEIEDFFGISVSISDYFAIIGADGNAGDQFGDSVSISGKFIVISSPNAQVGNNKSQGKAYIFELADIPPQINIVNCSSLFSSFECFWNQINSSLNDIYYQINYQTNIENWQLIQSPILIQNVFYQVFNSSFYSKITGNVDYSIQIRACNTTTQICGESSNQINLKTRIDSVNNLNFQSYSNSIQLNWNYPNVPIINSIPKLNHYLLSYQILNSNQSTNISISNSSTSFQINNLQSLTNYSISICGCRTEECLGEDQGEISTIQIQTNQKTTSSPKSKTTTIVLAIIIPIIVIIGIILTIILIRKKRNQRYKFQEKEQEFIDMCLFSDEN
ncbi:hypothetical protein M0811_06430 [Anaeramoeba ignava]|uniref:Fibronectin type-III domain-containing protein n=1 Tax=Anaeramoeba ignava TaxID=1746090 RepID=A0A9Q0LSF0_ANAIG|nr:hypothetical protein M0811_06430 [Anaeramoeba ignava]